MLFYLLYQRFVDFFVISKQLVLRCYGGVEVLSREISVVHGE